jgi:hypothetical protein
VSSEKIPFLSFGGVYKALAPTLIGIWVVFSESGGLCFANIQYIASIKYELSPFDKLENGDFDKLQKPRVRYHWQRD